MKITYLSVLLSMITLHHIKSMYDIGRFKEEMYTEIRTKKLYYSENFPKKMQPNINLPLIKAAKKTEAPNTQKKTIEQN